VNLNVMPDAWNRPEHPWVGISRLLHDVLDGIPAGEGVMPEVDAQISLAFASWCEPGMAGLIFKCVVFPSLSPSE
jgi:hypothetical protein